MKWGLVPGWAKEPKTPFSMINARAETVAHKPSFRKSFMSRRCLVPATGYFDGLKQRVVRASSRTGCRLEHSARQARERRAMLR